LKNRDIELLKQDFRTSKPKWTKIKLWYNKNWHLESQVVHQLYRGTC